jgi:thiamine biosynthesis protein ThiI
MKKKALCLLSDGLDSPVATFLTSEKGITVYGLNFNNEPYIGIKKGYEKTNYSSFSQVEKKPIYGVAQALVNAFSEQKELELFFVPHGRDLQEIITKGRNPKITCILCKRLMLKKAALLARKISAELIVMGDILGEQASQTITNLYVIEEVVKDVPVIRPNIGLNKEEVIALAREIGTYQFSEKAAKFTCTAVPSQPTTTGKLEDIYQAEELLEINRMVANSLKESVKCNFTKKID